LFATLSFPPSQARIEDFAAVRVQFGQRWCHEAEKSSMPSLLKSGKIRNYPSDLHIQILIDLIKPEGTGFMQKSFAFACSNTHSFKVITKETLAVRKLANDLAGPPSLGLS
jgi:hypothetical protein